MLVWWINHSGYTEGAHDKELEWSAKWNKQATELATARADAELAARSAEQRRQADIERVRQDAEKQIASAERDAVAADAVAVGLREQAGRLAKRASQCASDSGSAQSGDAAGQSAVVLADLLGRADARAGELAKAYDRARAAGLACQRAYLTLTNPD
ncbi:endopeptidase [Aeromonas veronii]|nr:endopeptidase [Aeromonas veronii]